MAHHRFMLPRKTTSDMETRPTPRGHKTLRPLPTHAVMANCLALPLHECQSLLRKSPLYSLQTKSHRGQRMHLPSCKTSLCHHATVGPAKIPSDAYFLAESILARALVNALAPPLYSRLITRDGSICIGDTSAPTKTPDGCNW